MSKNSLGPLGKVRELCAVGELDAASEIMLRFLSETLDLDCTRVTLNKDGYSLNSVNGILTLRAPRFGQEKLFFKYHQEDDESKGVTEYYNSKLLEDAGLPVDVPLAARTAPGEQILLYKVRTDSRLADVCRELEKGTGQTFSFDEVLRMQRDLDRQVGQKYLDSLHLAQRAQASGESLHQLFFHRLVDEANEHSSQPGGRLKAFYLGSTFVFPGLSEPLAWSELARLQWRINGRLYERTLDELFQDAISTLDPANLPDPCPVVLGHGDAHNANIWVERQNGSGRLVLFDPAFAGAHLPALLAEIKPTFHNILAHPDWLYHPEETTSRWRATARVCGNILEVEHDWELPALRREFLRSKEEHVWIPLLRALAEFPRSSDRANWESYVRLALFCCPTLVMNLTAGAGRHNPATSLLGLAIAMMCGSKCEEGGDIVGDFLERIAPPRRTT